MILYWNYYSVLFSFNNHCTTLSTNNTHTDMTVGLFDWVNSPRCSFLVFFYLSQRHFLNPNELNNPRVAGGFIWGKVVAPGAPAGFRTREPLNTRWDASQNTPRRNPNDVEVWSAVGSTPGFDYSHFTERLMLYCLAHYLSHILHSEWQTVENLFQIGSNRSVFLFCVQLLKVYRWATLFSTSLFKLFTSALEYEGWVYSNCKYIW